MELELSPYLIGVLSDPKHLEHFMSTKLLNCRQAVTTRRIEPSDDIPGLSLEEGEGNRIMLQQLGTGNQQVVA